jgi:hypothetical protein
MSQKTATEKERRIFSLKKHYLLTISQTKGKVSVDEFSGNFAL